MSPNFCLLVNTSLLRALTCHILYLLSNYVCSCSEKYFHVPKLILRYIIRTMSFDFYLFIFFNLLFLVIFFYIDADWVHILTHDNLVLITMWFWTMNLIFSRPSVKQLFLYIVLKLMSLQNYIVRNLLLELECMLQKAFALLLW